MFSATLSHITADAIVPEQLVHYVRAVSGRRAERWAEYIAYVHQGHAVLTAYPGGAGAGAWRERAERWAEAAGMPQHPFSDPDVPDKDAPDPPILADLLTEHARGLSSITVLAPFRPREAPEDAKSVADCYWRIALPLAAPGQKLRNMLARAGREVRVEPESWSDDHAALVRHYLQTRALPPGTRSIFSALGDYAGKSAEGDGALIPAGQLPGNVLLLAARRENGRLAGFSVGDFSGLHTAFYMFAFRGDDAPPGTADALLAGLIRHAESQGHDGVNLGLGISGGIAFFKKKWGAEPFLPYVETSWDLTSRKSGTGFLTGLRNLWSKTP